MRNFSLFLKRAVVASFLFSGNSLALADFIDSGQNLGGTSQSTSVELADFDGDTDLDAFVTNYDLHNRVYVNQGGAQGGVAGNFLDSAQILGSGTAQDVAIADIDDDGDLDAFTVIDSGNDANKIWINQGGSQGGTEGVFLLSGLTNGDDMSAAIAMGDLDGDNDPDAFIARSTGRANKVWMNNGIGLFFDDGQNLGNGSSSDVALGDLDDDGDLDAFVANGAANRVWINQGGVQGETEGDFLDSEQILGSSLSLGLALGDLDGDGDLDAFVANNGANTVWINQGGAQGGHPSTFGDSGQTLGSELSRGVSLRDFDYDSDLDAFVVNFGGNKVWINQGGAQGGTQGVFVDNGQSLGDSNSEDVALADLNGDGRADAFVANWGNADKIWINQDQSPIPNEDGWQIQVVEHRGETGLACDMVVDENGYPHICYFRHAYRQDGMNYSLYYSTWDGVQWDHEFVALKSHIDTDFAYSSIALDSSGFPHISFVSDVGEIDSQLHYAYWDGTQWTLTDVGSPGYVGPRTAIDLDSLNRPHICFEETNTNNLMYTYWNGSTWTTETIENTNMEAIYPSLKLDSSDTPHVSFHDEGPDAVIYATRNGTWQVDVVDEAGFVGVGFNEIDLDSHGYPHIVYTDNLLNRIMYAHWTGSTWQIETGVEYMGDDETLSRQVSLSLDSMDRPHISYMFSDNITISLHYLYWNGAEWFNEVVDNSSNVAVHNCIAVDDTDTVHIAYNDNSYGDLRYVKWAPRWSRTALDITSTITAPSLWVYQYTPYISHFNQTEGASKLAGWNDGWELTPFATCSGPVEQSSMVAKETIKGVAHYNSDTRDLEYSVWDGAIWSTRILDSTGDVGAHNDMIFFNKNSSLIRIAYWDATNYRIKLAVIDEPQAAQIYTNTAGPPLNSLSGFPSITAMPNGIGICYYDGVNEDVRYAFWNQGNNTWTDERVAGVDSVAGPLCDIDTDGSGGFPVITWFDQTTQTVNFAVRPDGTWEKEVAATINGHLSGLSMRMGFHSSEHPRIAYIIQPDDRVQFTYMKDGFWMIEDVESGNGFNFHDMSLAVDKKPYLAYQQNGQGLALLMRNATLDVNTTAEPAPPGFTGQGYNPMDACLAFLMGIDPDLKTDFKGPIFHPISPDSHNLGDLAIFQGMGGIFLATQEGREYIQFYMEHGAEMGTIALDDPQFLWDAFGTLQNNLPGWEALVIGRGDEMIISQKIVDDNYDIWSRVAEAGSPALKQDVNDILTRFNNLQDFSGKTFSEWAEMMGVVPPVITPTPTPSDNVEIELVMPAINFGQGDNCSLDLRVLNQGLTQTVDLYILLEIAGEYWCYPSWIDLHSGVDFQQRSIPSGLNETWSIIPMFVMPGVSPFGPMYFYSIMFEPGTLSVDTICSTIASYEFYLE